MIAFLALTGNTWVNVEDILYVRPSASHGSYVELRTGRGFEDSRPVEQLMPLLREVISGG